MKFWDVGVDNIVISKLIEMKSNSKSLIKYLDDVIRPLVLILTELELLNKNKETKITIRIIN